jgi:hypothetical protein
MIGSKALATVAMVALSACSDPCATCAASEVCVEGRCLASCDNTPECAAGETCFLGYCEATDGVPGGDATGGDATVCGNNLIQVPEVCDGSDVANLLACEDHGYTGGAVVACLVTCGGFDLSACAAGPGSCGNGNQQGQELCDDVELGNQSCVSLGFASGVLACNANCSWDVGACVE